MAECRIVYPVVAGSNPAVLAFGKMGRMGSLDVLGSLTCWQSEIVHSQRKSAVRRFFLKFRVDIGR